jgi:hypothetical protein
MKLGWIVFAVAGLVTGLAVIAADPALARTKHKAHSVCVDRRQTFTWGGIITNGAPRPNGCAPAVYQYGRYVGQDTDPFIRQQLMRDPQTGYTQY